MAPTSQKSILNYTVRELYSIDRTSEQEVFLVHSMPDAKVQLTPSIPLSTRFVYQSPPSKVEDRDTLARLMFQVVPQVFESIAGKMPVVMFDIEEDGSARKQSFNVYFSRIPIRCFSNFRLVCPVSSPRSAFCRWASRHRRPSWRRNRCCAPDGLHASSNTYCGP